MESRYTSRQSSSAQEETESVLESRKKQRTGYYSAFWPQTQSTGTFNYRRYPQVNKAPQKPRPPDKFSLILPDTNTELIFIKGSVTDFKGESIVNAANEQCLGGGGVDGAITKAGGQKLADHRQKLPILYDNVRVPTGDARITIGGDLNASYCIHAVGPDFRTVENPYQSLDASYISVLREAKMNQLKEIAFIPLSSGIFRGSEPVKKVIKTGLEAIVNNTYNGLERVYMYGFKYEEMETFHTLYLKLKKMIN